MILVHDVLTVSPFVHITWVGCRVYLKVEIQSGLVLVFI